MKNFVIIILIAVFANTGMYGQSKKDLEIKIKSLETELDSTQKVLDPYLKMYTTIQKKVLPYNFDPADIAEIIDSLRTAREGDLSNVMGVSEALRDTIDFMSKSIVDLEKQVAGQKLEIEELEAKIKELSTTTETLTDDQISALEKIKKLFDDGILTQKEFESRKQNILKK